MSASDVERLRRERDEALAALRGHVAGFTGMAQAQSGQWVGAHPYAATAGAAAAGFLAARLVLRPQRHERVAHLHMRGRAASAGRNGNGNHTTRGTSAGDWMEIVLALAEAMLAAQAQSGAASTGDAGVGVGDVGSAEGGVFPGSFAAAG